VNDEVVDRFCIIGPPEAHIARLEELKAVGVDQFNIYLMNGEEERCLDDYKAIVARVG
jgi:alkanesulfonate monooxygenase SsuD/methylene tetrahydromethanopterin reductase-like flavin-dependent oxidoreductase (luciferase family)